MKFNHAKQMFTASLAALTLAATATMAQVPGQTVRQYAIRTSGGFFLTAERGGGLPSGNAIHTNRNQMGEWELFTIGPAENGMVTLRTSDGLHYVTAEGPGGLATSRTVVGPCEKFTLVPLGRNRFSLVTCANTYVTATELGGRTDSSAVSTDLTSRALGQSFDLIPIDPQSIGRAH